MQSGKWRVAEYPLRASERYTARSAEYILYRDIRSSCFEQPHFSCDKLGTSPPPYPSFLLILTSRTLKTNLLICRQTYLKTSRNLLICRWEPTFSKGNILPICRRIRYHSIIKTYKYVAGTPSPPHQQVTYLSQQ